MRIVVALGGNALLRRGERPDYDVQEHNVDVAITALAPLAHEHELIVTHGNGPQVGMLALESASDPALSRPYPLDTLVAETQGLIGYWLQQELQRKLRGRTVVAIVTQTVVDADDPAFASPTKFVGPMYEEGEARRIAADRGWTVSPDGAGWRRVVASPAPIRIVETPVVELLLDTNTVVVCAGGGGIAVVSTDHGLRGVEAVVDKDLTSSLLAIGLGADALLVLTDVDGIYRNFGTPERELIGEITARELRVMDFPDGSMAPKVDAVCSFVERTGGIAAIGSLTDVAHLLDGTAGTRVTP